ncbi:prepilin-type N-terminal cleavage/methylation domain-containing protein [Erwinia rhapontici]
MNYQEGFTLIELMIVICSVLL